MVYAFVLFFIFICFISSLPKKVMSSDKVYLLLLNAFIIVFFTITFSLGYVNADQDNYRFLFEQIRTGQEASITSQIGLVYLYKLCVLLGLSYNFSLFIIFSIGITLINSTVRKYSSNALLVYILYFIYPFFLDVVQIKHFIAMSLIVFSFRFSFTNNGFLVSLLLLIIASSFHYVAIFFVPLVFVYRYSFKSVFCLSVFVSVIMLFVVKSQLYLYFLTSEILLFRVKSYLENAPKYGFIIQMLIQSFFILCVYLCKRKLDRHKKGNLFFDAIMYANVYLIILFPLYMINGNFDRIFRVLYIPNYMILVSYISLFNVNKRLVLTTASIAFVGALSTWYFNGIYEITIIPILEFNYFFDFF
jgi:hypothetical protein